MIREYKVLYKCRLCGEVFGSMTTRSDEVVMNGCIHLYSKEASS